MGVSRFTILANLGHNGKMTLTEISQIIMTKKSTVPNIIDNLEKHNLVERIRDSKDRRKIYIDLTRQGSEMNAKLKQIRSIFLFYFQVYLFNHFFKGEQMRKILEKNIVLFFSFIIFGGLLWGVSGLGFILGKNWNIVNLLLGGNRRIEGLIYLFIGLCTLVKSLYNMLWDRPKDPPYIVFIIFIVVASGFYWGIIGVGLLLGVNLNLIEILPAENTTVLGILNYSIGLLALIKLFNFIHTKKALPIIRKN